MIHSSFSAPGVLGRSLRALGQNVPLVLLYVAITVAPGLALLSHPGLLAPVLAIQALLGAAAGGALALGVVRRLGVVTTTLSAGRRAGHVALATLGFVFAAAAALCLIVPGVVCMFWLVIPVAAVEHPGLLGAFRRSRDLTQGAKGTVFSVLVVLLAGNALALFLVAPTGGIWAVLGVNALFGAWTAAAAAVAYFDLRAIAD